MRASILRAISALVLFTAGVVSAQGQEQGEVRREYKTILMKTNSSDSNQQADPNNKVAGDVNQQTQPPKQGRERIHRQMQGRLPPLSPGEARGKDRIRPGMPTDANGLSAVKGRGEPNGREEAAGKTPAKGAQRQQQFTNIEQQISQEEAKHRDRLARLMRIRELAEQQGNTEMVAKSDKLLEDENKLYVSKIQRMSHRRNRIIEFADKNTPDVNKMTNGYDANRAGNRPSVKDRRPK
jgi:hypothetical protein